ncbi:glycoside hydrolase family 125 protein [Streptomyces sp. NPDC000880]
MTTDSAPDGRITAATDLRKPLDLGNGLVAASFGGDGSWLSLGAPHPEHGFIEVSGAPPFDESNRGKPAEVRQHRGRLTEERYAFLRLDLPGENVMARTAGLDDDGRLIWGRSGAGWTCVTTASALPDQHALVQRHTLSITPGLRPVLRFRGRLDRCALAEITEVNPPAPICVETVLHCEGNQLTLHAPLLDSSAHITVRASAGRWTPRVQDGPYKGAHLELRTDAADGHTVELSVTVSLAPPKRPAEHRPSPTVASPRLPGGATGTLARIASGALRYTLGCCAMDVGHQERAILTDHRLLPLSWTRDAYYQALLLLRAAPRERPVTDVVAAHLRWLWGRGCVQGGLWMRSHQPDGRPKDLAVQADQQLYPVLELADYRRVTGAWPEPPADRADDPAGYWGERVAEVWAGLPRQGRDGLLAGAENPADDPSELPFALSTQILYWHTCRQLDPWQKELGIEQLRPASVAEGLRRAVERVFGCEGPYGPQWAYESDAAGGHRLYQDANDLPTAFAPQWGFCSARDERWAATMRFAFSPHNSGYVQGRYGGLGSAHTPGTWTLGDAQELAVARATGDDARALAVVNRLGRVAGVDGMLPETYEADSGDWLARHWFAWPAAVCGLLHLDITDS